MCVCDEMSVSLCHTSSWGAINNLLLLLLRGKENRSELEPAYTCYLPAWPDGLTVLQHFSYCLALSGTLVLFALASALSEF